MLQAHAAEALQAYVPQDDIQLGYQQRMLALVSRCAEFHSAAQFPAHLTASAWVVDAEQQHAAMVFHRKLQRWLQPGGHIEAEDQSLAAAAQREATEETGLLQLELCTPQIFDLDIHKIPARGDLPAHEHFDVRYCFRSQQRQLHISDESSDLAWVALDALGLLDTDESVLRLARKLSSI